MLAVRVQALSVAHVEEEHGTPVGLPGLVPFVKARRARLLSLAPLPGGRVEGVRGEGLSSEPAVPKRPKDRKVRVRDCLRLDDLSKGRKLVWAGIVLGSRLVSKPLYVVGVGLVELLRGHGHHFGIQSRVQDCRQLQLAGRASGRRASPASPNTSRRKGRVGDHRPWQPLVAWAVRRPSDPEQADPSVGLNPSALYRVEDALRWVRTCVHPDGSDRLGACPPCVLQGLEPKWLRYIHHCRELTGCHFLHTCNLTIYCLYLYICIHDMCIYLCT